MLPGNDILVLNGDSYCDVSLSSVLQRHKSRQFAGTLVVRYVNDAGRYGRVAFCDSHTITAFHEKMNDSIPGWISAGIYCLRRDLLEAIPENRRVSLEREMFPSWVEIGLQAYPTSGSFIDIGTPESYSRAAEILGAPETMTVPAGSNGE